VKILAIDPGSNLGWATDASGRLEWGTEDFRVKHGENSGARWQRFGAWLAFATKRRGDPPAWQGVDAIVYEKSHFPSTARYAADIAAGFTTRLEEHCERHGIALHPVPVQTLKAFAIPKVKRKKGDPKMDRGKEAMIRAAIWKLADDLAKSTGFDKSAISIYRKQYDNPLTEHEADALWLFWFGKEVVCATK
jgi:hypothetical protein